MKIYSYKVLISHTRKMLSDFAKFRNRGQHRHKKNTNERNPPAPPAACCPTDLLGGPTDPERPERTKGGATRQGVKANKNRSFCLFLFAALMSQGIKSCWDIWHSNVAFTCFSSDQCKQLILYCRFSALWLIGMRFLHPRGFMFRRFLCRNMLSSSLLPMRGRFPRL